MYQVIEPKSEKDFHDYYLFRWQMLKKPWQLPLGSEKDAYDPHSYHRMIRDHHGITIAVARFYQGEADEAQLSHMAVDPAYRGKGLGTLLISSLEELARQLGVKRLVLSSREMAIPFYRKCGFRETGEKQGRQPSKRLQMMKELSPFHAIIRHPKWCQELQLLWYQSIPISEKMGICIYQYTGKLLETRANLQANINPHDTMFAGSVYSLAVLTGWGMLHLQMREKGLDGDIIMAKGEIDYHQPITQTPAGFVHVERIKGDLSVLHSGKRARMAVQVGVTSGQQQAATLNAQFVIMPACHQADV